MILLQTKKQLINHIVLLGKWHLTSNTSPMKIVFIQIKSLMNYNRSLSRVITHGSNQLKLLLNRSI